MLLFFVKPTLKIMENHLIQGQIEALMPKYLAAKEKFETAKEEFDSLKKEMMEIIPTPQTINTSWGKLIRKKGSRSVTVTDKALKAKLTAMKEKAVKSGEAKESYAADHIEFRSS